MSALQNAAPDVSVEAEREILFRVVNRVAIITLNRPSILNALSHDMGKRLGTTVQFFVDVTGASGTSYLLWDVSLSGNDQQDIVTG